MALEALLRKWHIEDDVDVLREGVHVLAKALMELEVAHQRRGLVKTTPKTWQSRRLIILSDRAASEPPAHRRRQIEARLKAGLVWKGHNLIFCTPYGPPVQPSKISARFERALVSAGLPEMRFHDLRHSAATLPLGEEPSSQSGIRDVGD